MRAAEFIEFEYLPLLGTNGCEIRSLGDSKLRSLVNFQQHSPSKMVDYDNPINSRLYSRNIYNVRLPTNNPNLSCRIPVFCIPLRANWNETVLESVWRNLRIGESRLFDKWILSTVQEICPPSRILKIPSRRTRHSKCHPAERDNGIDISLVPNQGQSPIHADVWRSRP